MNSDIRHSGGLAIIYDGKILLAKTAGRSDKRSWGIPKGGVEDGESNIEAAIRETYEELGIKVPKSLVNSREYSIFINAKKWGYYKYLHYFVVELKDLSQIGLNSLQVSKSKLDTKEISAAGFMEYSEALEHIMISQTDVLNQLSNYLVESKTIAGEEVEPNMEPNVAQQGETEDARLYKIRQFKAKIKDFESYWNDRINQNRN